MHKKMRWGKLVFLCLVLVIAYLVGKNKINARIQELTAEETSLRIQLSDLRDDTSELERQIGVVGTDVYVMNVARQDYDYLKPGELRFEYVNAQALKDYTEEEARIREYELSVD